ncbi:MgtC family protein [bacterium YEK0313]|nr:MgtC family protein [bacterium YEK0313]
MTDLELFHRFGVAIAIGALVGVERHWRERDEPEGRRTAGIRTFSLIGMLGGGAGLLEQALKATGGVPGLVLVGLFLGFAATFTRFKLREAAAEKDFSATTAVAAMLTYVLGAIAVLGDMRIAAAGGVVLAGVLASREALHGFMRTLTWPELRSAIMLLAMTLVVLPLVPTDPVGPFGGLSPARIWTLAILLASISFAGYVAVKLVGGRYGELLAGAAGGLLSSTALTLTNARRSMVEPAPGLLAAGALAAGAISYIRTGLLVMALAPGLTILLVPALTAGALVMLAAAGALAARNGGDGAEAAKSARNPFELWSVLQMALLLAVIGFLARAATTWFGNAGIIIVSVLAGLADVDAATLTVAGMIGGGLAFETASLAILAAVASNTLAKVGYGLMLGSPAFAWRFGASSLAALAAGLGGLAAGSLAT